MSPKCTNAILKPFVELFRLYVGLLENSSQCADRKFTVKRHDAALGPFSRLSLQDHVAAAVPDSDESKFFERANGLFTGDPAQLRHVI